ncbi:peptidoglycan DD-metalloendopeptidase family protein [Celerinatantimonas yamalensis]|uniref:Peptidoglycan DD-metalloendopeptidase family protein n=1 Tax=Celerinatantimonas yamalensis TaxID=559956 RepID=A0ABW9G7W2_9GAMM
MRCRSLLIALVVVLCSACSSGPHPVPVVSAGAYNQYNQGVLDRTWYRVKHGDTLYSIAWRAGHKIKTLARLNHLKSPYIIYPGQRLRLKWSTTTSTMNKSKAINHVKRLHLLVKQPSSHNNHDQVQKKHKSAVVTHETKQYVESVPSKIKLDVNSDEAVKRWVWPATGRILSGFSSQVTGNKGIDIAGRRNQAIYAAAAGRVVYAGNALRGYGNLIIIKHNDDYLSAYAHNSRILVKEHQTVKAGQHIADMGETGTTSVRLHFEIRYKGKSVDPLKYLPKH